MMVRSGLVYALMGSLTIAPGMIGCESLPGDEGTQGAVIGGLGGAAAGAMVAGDDDRLIGALIGGALGAGGGYLIGQQVGKSDKDEAIEVSEEARQSPASPNEALQARTADVNEDGFVTLDEVVAMQRAGLNDRQMINRLEATGQIFALDQSQEQYLRDRRVSQDVIVRMRTLNRAGQPAAAEVEQQIGTDPY